MAKSILSITLAVVLFASGASAHDEPAWRLYRFYVGTTNGELDGKLVAIPEKWIHWATFDSPDLGTEANQYGCQAVAETSQELNRLDGQQWFCRYTKSGGNLEMEIK